MASNPKFCGICDQLHITKPSSDWCSECNQALCTECKGFHALSKASQHHSTISISNYLALDSSFSQVKGHCSVHDDKYQLFCQSHDCLLCLTCLEEHTKCGDVVRISKLTKDVKTSESFVDTQKSLSDIICNLSKIQCHLEGNVCEIKKQKESILRDIAQMRKEIDSHLDKIEKSLKIELSKVVEDQCDNTFCKTLEDIKRKKIEIEKCQLEMDDLNRYGSDLQTFFGLREISAKTSTIDQCLHTLDDDSSLNRVSISCKINTTISGFVEEVARLGTIQVQKIQSKINLERSKDKQAQLVGVRNKYINDINLTLVNTIKLDAIVTGCCFLPAGNIVICDRSYRNEGIQIFNPNGGLLSKFPLPQHSSTFDVTCINDSNVAVSSDFCKKIEILNIETKAIRSIRTKDVCSGIIHKDGSLMVCVEGKGVQNVNTQNGKNTSIVPCDLGSWSYIATSENKLYYTNNKNHSVTCCDMEGNSIWTFKDENVVKNPFGVAVDNAGNVYIVSYSQHTLIVLSADGQQVRQLLSKDDGLHDPRAIAYDRTKNRLCVINLQNNGFLFDVSF